MITTIVTGTLNIVVVVVTIHIRMVDRMRRIGRWIHVIWACVSQSIEIRSRRLYGNNSKCCIDVYRYIMLFAFMFLVLPYGDQKEEGKQYPTHINITVVAFPGRLAIHDRESKEHFEIVTIHDTYVIVTL